MTEKITERHLQRKAILYVRQSSPQQVARNEESRRLQYAMEGRLRSLGWQQVEVVDEDQGRSASGSTRRAGFETMVAEVCLGHVGAVAAREVSRFARNSRDWQQLVEVCRMVDTLLIDHEMVYDPRSGNDRLLLGVKGSLNEYELDVLRLRSLEARRQKARRGELLMSVPTGYVKGDEDRLEKDPDRRVQQALGLVFAKFLKEGSVRRTLHWFLEHGVELPVRSHGPLGWDVIWKRPGYARVMAILTNPAYAGAYAFGRTRVEIEYQAGRARRRYTRRPMEAWRVLLYDQHDGYIDWATFERIQAMIRANSWKGTESGSGAARRGPALLTGLLRCRRCGRKLTVSYTGSRHDAIRYGCLRGRLDQGEPRCIGFGGGPIDVAISAEILRVVEPGAIEAARRAEEQAAQSRDDLVASARLALEEARYGAERARRQYAAVDPENRLVADELERRWNGALGRVQQLEDRLSHEESRRDQEVSPAREAFEDLAGRFEEIWADPRTDVRLKKRIARTLIEEIVVDVDRARGRIEVVIHWKGGVHTELDVRCRRRGENRCHTPMDVVEAIGVLSRTCSDLLIAGILNRNGKRTGRGLRWTEKRIAELRSRRGIPRHSPERQRQEGWLTLTQAAGRLRLSPKTLRRAVERGEVRADHPLPDGPWVLHGPDLDDPRVQTAIGRIRGRRAGAGQDPAQRSLFTATT